MAYGHVPDEITAGQDIIDSRDVIARIEHLEETRQDLETDVETAEDALKEFEAEDDGDTQWAKDGSTPDELREAVEKAKSALADWDDDSEADELKKLKALAAEAEGYGDWDGGETLIAESHFVEYCEELTKDIGDLPKDIPSYLVIDWEATADNLREDYTEVEFDGTTYLMRA